MENTKINETENMEMNNENNGAATEEEASKSPIKKAVDAFNKHKKVILGVGIAAAGIGIAKKIKDSLVSDYEEDEDEDDKDKEGEETEE